MPSPTGETRTEKDEEQKARWMNDGQTFGSTQKRPCWSTRTGNFTFHRLEPRSSSTNFPKATPKSREFQNVPVIKY